MTVGTMLFSRCRLVLLGSHAARYVLDITCGTPGAAPGQAAAPITDRAGVLTTSGYRRLDVTSAQRRYLAALCERILTGIGATPAAYREIAERCGVAPQTVRNSLDALRHKLSAEQGIPGLVHAGAIDGEGPGAVSFLSALAAWAVHSGTINRDDLEDLDR